jgi:hypothetical protein
MFKAEYEGIIDVHFAASEVVSAGLVAMLDSENAGVVKISDGTAAFGFFAQGNRNYADGYADYRSAVNPIPGLGEKIGVYREGGRFVTDQFVGKTFAPGDVLYVTTEGKLTATKSETTPDEASGTIEVGIAVEFNSGELVFVSLL